MKHGKNYRTAKATLDKDQEISLGGALELLAAMPKTKFDETVDMAVRLNVNPRHADQMVRGTVVLPHGTGKSKKVLVIAAGEKAKEAEEAGAAFVGGPEMAKKIQEGWLDFDAVIATSDKTR